MLESRTQHVEHALGTTNALFLHVHEGTRLQRSPGVTADALSAAVTGDGLVHDHAGSRRVGFRLFEVAAASTARSPAAERGTELESLRALEAVAPAVHGPQDSGEDAGHHALARSSCPRLPTARRLSYTPGGGPERVGRGEQ